MLRRRLPVEGIGTCRDERRGQPGLPGTQSVRTLFTVGRSVWVDLEIAVRVADRKNVERPAGTDHSKIGAIDKVQTRYPVHTVWPCLHSDPANQHAGIKDETMPLIKERVGSSPPKIPYILGDRKAFVDRMNRRSSATKCN